MRCSSKRVSSKDTKKSSKYEIRRAILDEAPKLRILGLSKQGLRQKCKPPPTTQLESIGLSSIL
uniref:Uncharacterized protein n=1 Tax=Solanum lycopersicum TaxID=4081 RepID=A0A3Q7GFM0_SOLLC